MLDHLPVERERGITVKAQTASMVYQSQGHSYLLNLIDTPVITVYTCISTVMPYTHGRVTSMGMADVQMCTCAEMRHICIGT